MFLENDNSPAAVSRFVYCTWTIQFVDLDYASAPIVSPSQTIHVVPQCPSTGLHMVVAMLQLVDLSLHLIHKFNHFLQHGISLQIYRPPSKGTTTISCHPSWSRKSPQMGL